MALVSGRNTLSTKNEKVILASILALTSALVIYLFFQIKSSATYEKEGQALKNASFDLRGFLLEINGTAYKDFINASLNIRSGRCRISSIGLGYTLNFFNYLKNYNYTCDYQACNFTFCFHKPQAWEGEALLVARGIADEMIVIDLEIEITFQSTGYLWSYPILIFEGCSLNTVAETVTKPERPILLNLDRDTNLFFLDLNGKESIYEGSDYELIVTRSGLGFRSSNLEVTAGRTYTSRFRFYLWRGGLMRIYEALNDLSNLCAYCVDREENLRKAKRVLDSLLHPKSEKDVFLLGHYLGPRKLFKAYVGDTRLRIEEAELITQANLLLGACYYHKVTGDPDALSLVRLILRETMNFSIFFSDYTGVYSNNFLIAGRMDSWYQVTNPVMLIEAHLLLPNVVPVDTSKLVRHARFLIQLAHKVDYAFPVFVWPDLKVEQVGAESDVALGYSYFMVLMYKLTGDKEFLGEAVTSLEKYLTISYGHLYESHLTTMGIAASAELYRLTGEERFLKYIEELLWLALRWMNFLRGDIIEQPVPYTLVAAMPKTYVAAFEYGLFKYFLERAVNTLREASVRHEALEGLYAFYASCTAVVAKYAFPQFLNVSEKLEVRGGVIDPAYWIPIEDVYPVKIYGWGALPQEIYGAGSQIIALVPPVLGEDPSTYKVGER